jgi:hypothetical protein
MHRRLLSSGRFDVPAHLKQTFFTPLTGRCMIVGRPIWRYPLADVRQPQSEVAPLITAIRDLPSESRPFRMVSHEDATGQVFNASFFVDEPTMNSFLQWYDENALNPSGPYHECLKAPAADEVPTPETLLFGAGTSVLADTRFGEYQLGSTHRPPRLCSCRRRPFVPCRRPASSPAASVTWPRAEPRLSARAARCTRAQRVVWPFVGGRRHGRPPRAARACSCFCSGGTLLAIRAALGGGARRGSGGGGER